LNDFRAQLVNTFWNQYKFSTDYSPLYASFFAAVAGWIDGDQPDTVGDWLLEASHDRRPLDISLLLAAGLHHDILQGVPELFDLAQYYPSVSGTLRAGFLSGDSWIINPDFRRILKLAILARRESLHAFIRSRQVQTNETGRGMSWLLPVSMAGWPRVHLLDLGASAGLNLVAEKRSFQFVDNNKEAGCFHLGEGGPIQFEVFSDPGSDFPSSATIRTPKILSRIGCDIAPFFLSTPSDEITLASFVWADQVTRMNRLKEGIAAYRQAETSAAPVLLHAVKLPDELPDFLEQTIRKDIEPLVCYNTFIRMYLPEKGFALRRYLAGWARKQERPVVWIQWEPPSSLNNRHGEAPDYGWLAWTIDMWHQGQEQHWHIAWVHPHGQHVRWLPDLEDWITKTNLF
jgi:hypothetical protein